jgi:L-amino acid N-acyltransferase YncA
VIIRDATDEDWPSIGSFFAAIVRAGTTYAYPENLSSAEAQALWMAEPPGRTVVAVSDERILGSATMGPNRPGRGSHIATASFMVDPEYHGRGTGRALGLHVVSWARASGYLGMQFNAVVETNHAAVHLWQELGFEILATVPGTFNHREYGYVGLHVMFQSFSAG